MCVSVRGLSGGGDEEATHVHWCSLFFLPQRVSGCARLCPSVPGEEPDDVVNRQSQAEEGQGSNGGGRREIQPEEIADITGLTETDAVAPPL